MSSSPGRRRGRSRRRAAKDKQEADDVFSPEHASVERVEDGDADYVEEHDGNTKRVRRSKRVRRGARADDQVKDDEEVGDEEEDDDDSLLGRPDPAVAHVETVSLEQASLALSMAAAGLSELRDQAVYYRGVGGRVPNDPLLLRVEKAMENTLYTMEGWLEHATQAGPVEHHVAPSIPEADGSEKRFTNVAATLGIHWSHVHPDAKKTIYERALQLYVEHYGTRPRQVNMWTSEGFKPVYYYSEDRYRNTMLQALEEYQAQAMQGVASPVRSPIVNDNNDAAGR